MPKTRNAWFIGLFTFIFLQGAAFSADSFMVNCVVCGMDVKSLSKMGFESMKDDKPVHFCSLSCAMRFHETYKDAPIMGYDFETSNKVDTKNAFFLVKSSKILKELEFGMPPSVVVFSSRESADRTQSRLGDGQIVKSFDQAAQAFR